MLAAAILGVMVIGGMTNELVSVSTPLAIGSGDSANKNSINFRWHYARYVSIRSNRTLLQITWQECKCYVDNYWNSNIRYYLCSIWNF